MAMILLGSGRNSGMVHMTKVLQWRDRGFLGKTSQEDEEGELLFM